MRRILRLAVALAVLTVSAGLAFAAFAWRSEIDPRDPPPRTAFDENVVEKGAGLAAVGNCIACRTVPGREAFAGGLLLPTPFGTIYSTNITPDPETGIGRWSEARSSGPCARAWTARATTSTRPFPTITTRWSRPRTVGRSTPT